MKPSAILRLDEEIMSRYDPIALQQQLRTHLTCFPVTHATQDLEFDESRYRDHIALLATFKPAAITAPGGTGEFFALTPAEVADVLRAAVDVAPEHSAVLGSAGYGTAMAVEMAHDAEVAGADGLFLLPPYLTEFDQVGLYQHVRRVCDSTNLGVLVYHRDRARFTVETVERLAEDCPNFVAFKDGVGDIDLMAKIAANLGGRLSLVDGMPTAEINAAAYFGVGCDTYSSAIFNFMPEWAVSFYQAVRARDVETVHRELRDFVVPFLAIRDRVPGYAVAIIKAGMSAVGRSAGPTRPPLVDLKPKELEEVEALVGTR